MPLVNYALITIEIRSELPLCEAWRLTMIDGECTECMCILLTISNNSYAGLNSQFSKPASKQKVDGRISNCQYVSIRKCNSYSTFETISYK